VICPKCQSTKSQIVSHDQGMYYCPDCNHAWGGKKESSGTLAFNGAEDAKQLFEMMFKNQNVTPEIRAIWETQITAVMMDQWFEGLKVGQLLSITYAKDFYGKDRNESSRATGSRQEAVKVASVGNRKDGLRTRTNDPADPRNAGVDRTVTERVAGIDFSYPYSLSHQVTPEMYEYIAGNVNSFFGTGVTVKGAFLDAQGLSFRI
jgi:hypothetical protein